MYEKGDSKRSLAFTVYHDNIKKNPTTYKSKIIIFFYASKYNDNLEHTLQIWTDRFTDTLQFNNAKINHQTFEIRSITSKVQTDLCYIHYLIANQAVTYNIYRFFFKTTFIWYL